jgi:hypothetical protein
MLSDTDAQILREHWSGHEDILASIQKVLTAVDNLLAGDVISKLKKMAD